MKNFRKLEFVRLLLPVFMVIQLCSTGVADDMKKAEKFLTTRQYSQAEQIYKSIIDKADPNKPEELESALNARAKLSSVYLSNDQQSHAQVVLQQLLTKHAKHKRLPHAIHEIVEQTKQDNKVLEAGQTYQNILTAQPKHPQRIWLKMGIAIANAHLDDDQAVDTILQNIITEHVTDERSAEAFAHIAWAYRKLEQYYRTLDIYQYVVDNWSDKDRAIFSQHGIIVCNLKLGDQEAADAATEQLLQKYAGDKNMAEVLSYLAGEYIMRKDWERAQLLCEYIQKNYPGNEYAILVQQSLITASIGQKDTIGVQTGLQELFAKFASDKKMPSTIYWTAKKLNHYDDNTAQQLYQYIINNHPNHDLVPSARINLGHIKIRQGDDNAAEAIFNRILTQHKDHPTLPEMLMLIAEGYWEKALFTPKKDRKVTDRAKADFQKALANFEAIIIQFPEIPVTTADAYFFAGECYYQLGKYDKAIEYCQKVIDNWPDYLHAWNAGFRIVKANKKLLEAGTISESQADAKIIASYKCIVEKFPECRAVGVAQKGLNYYLKKSSKEGGLK